MPYALQCVNGANKDRWFDPYLPSRWNDIQPKFIGRGVYAAEQVATATALRILKLKKHSGVILKVVLVEAKNNQAV